MTKSHPFSYHNIMLLSDVCCIAESIIQKKNVFINLTFVFASAFEPHVKFQSTSHKRKCYVWALPFVAMDSIHENSNADVTYERSFATRNS